MQQRPHWAIPFAAVLVLGACSTAPQSTRPASQPQEQPPPKPWLDASAFGDRPAMSAPSAIYALSPVQRAEFLRYFHAERNRERAPNRRVADYLESRMSGFNYYSDTVTARAAMEGQQGNCLSLGLLTRSLARLVNVEMEFELVESRPVYHKEDNVIVSSRHVRTRLLDPLPGAEHDNTILYRGGIVVDYFPTRGSRVLRSIDATEVTSMFYQNHAGEALIDDDYNLAYWLLRRALTLNPDSPSAINMMALTYHRVGQHDTAERLYRYGLERAEDKVRLLSNYHLLLKERGRRQEAQAIAERIEKLDRGNPFRWISVANEAYNKRHYNRALDYYKKAEEIAPYLPDVYAGIARAHYQLGHLGAARRALDKAVAKARRDESRQRYLAKKQALGSELEP